MTFKLSVITPEQTLFSGPADMVVVPGTEGDMGVLPGHAPVISTLRPGLISIEKGGAPAERIAVLDGIVEITPEGVTVLSDTARAIFGMNADGARDELVRVQAEVAKTDGEISPTLARRLQMAETLVSAL